jgi:glutamine amidotransferase
VILASERMDSDPGWRPMKPGELVHIDDSLRVSAHELLHDAPMHPLTIDDLSPHAKASQASTSS